MNTANGNALPAADAALPSPTESTRPDVSVLVVNYNTAQLLPEMQAALKRSQQGLALETILVDNASRDDSVDLLRREFSHARLIFNEKNVGFGRANNQAAAEATGRYLLLLNTDAFVAPDTLRKTVDYMDAHPECGVLGVRLVGRDGTLQPGCRYFPTPWNVFLARARVARFFPGTRLVDDLSWDQGSTRECDWVVGCYLLVRRAVVEQVGLFDPRYFLYCEEVDLCQAAKRAGWKVVFFGETEVVHLGGESAKSEGRLTEGRQLGALQMESELLYFRKQAGRLGLASHLALSLLAQTVLLAKALLQGRTMAGLASSISSVTMLLRLTAATRFGKLPTR